MHRRYHVMYCCPTGSAEPLFFDSADTFNGAVRAANPLYIRRDYQGEDIGAIFIEDKRPDEPMAWQ